MTMLIPGDPRFDEMLGLAQLASAARFNDEQRMRWRSLCTGMLGSLHQQGAGSNRRRAVRGTAAMPVSVLYPEHLSGSAMTSTVSSGGLSLRSHSTIPVGSTLELSITIPERRVPFFISGEVVWTRSGEVGVAFIEMPETDREMLEAVAVKALLVYVALE